MLPFRLPPALTGEEVRMRIVLRFLVLACIVALGGSAFAQAPERWPTKPIRLVVPFAPGGSSEIIARSLAARLSTSLGQQVYVENKPGGAGNVRSEERRVGKEGRYGWAAEHDKV